MKQERRINWLVAILFSLITGFIISSMIFTGGNMDKFYNEGDILEVPRKDMNMTLAGILYSEDGQQYTVTETNASMSWTSYAKNNAWKYIALTFPRLHN